MLRLDGYLGISGAEVSPEHRKKVQKLANI